MANSRSLVSWDQNTWFQGFGNEKEKAMLQKKEVANKIQENVRAAFDIPLTSLILKRLTFW